MKGITAFMLTAFFAVAAHADDKMDWKACDKEVKEYSCKGVDKDVWACLENHDDKLSKACQVVHAKGDDKFKAKDK